MLLDHLQIAGAEGKRTSVAQLEGRPVTRRRARGAEVERFTNTDIAYSFPTTLMKIAGARRRSGDVNLVDWDFAGGRHSTIAIKSAWSPA
jgi:hypothetical protein